MGDGDVFVAMDGEYATVWYHRKENVIHHQFKKFIFGEAFRDVLRKHLELMERYGVHKILSDDRQNGPLTPEDAVWAMANYQMQVVAMGKRYWAVVLPELVVGQMNMRRRMKQYSELGVTVKGFTDPDKAFEWLVAQP